MTATEARQAILASLSTLPDGDAVIIARLVALLPMAALRARLADAREVETSRHGHPLTPTTRAQWIDGLAFQLLDAIGRFGR